MDCVRCSLERAWLQALMGNQTESVKCNLYKER